jgi:hypothetical protein
MTNKQHAYPWTPLARGLLYCSPACGAGCTRAAFDRAVRRGDALAKRLGPGWTSHVWENMGWFYMARSACGRWRVSPVTYGGKRKGYIAGVGEADSPGCRWRHQYGATAEAALAAAMTAARAEVGRDAALLDLVLTDRRFVSGKPITIVSDGTFYVDRIKGNDKNPGTTVDRPLRTWAELMRRQKAKAGSVRSLPLTVLAVDRPRTKRRKATARRRSS